MSVPKLPIKHYKKYDTIRLSWSPRYILCTFMHINRNNSFQSWNHMAKNSKKTIAKWFLIVELEALIPHICSSPRMRKLTELNTLGYTAALSRERQFKFKFPLQLPLWPKSACNNNCNLEYMENRYTTRIKFWDINVLQIPSGKG